MRAATSSEDRLTNESARNIFDLARSIESTYGSLISKSLLFLSVEASGGGAERPRLHQPDAVISAGAAGAAGRAAEESLHLRCLLRGLHQTNINLR